MLWCVISMVNEAKEEKAKKASAQISVAEQNADHGDKEDIPSEKSGEDQ